MDIKPIETVYNGYRFRSRLEARWAVFFDAAGISYEYEPEGFKLKNGRKYLPDFFLPDFGIYVEIKPILSKDDPTREEQYKNQESLCSDFRDEVGKAILLYRGAPWDDIWGILYAFDTKESGSGGTSDYDARFVDVSDAPYDKPTPILMVGDYGFGRTICVSCDMQCNKRVGNGEMIVNRYPEYAVYMVLQDMTHCFNPYAQDLWNKAKQAAKQSRFEHGETPMIRR